MTLAELRLVREAIKTIYQAYGPTHEQYHALDALDEFLDRKLENEGEYKLCLIGPAKERPSFSIDYEDENGE